MTRFLASRTERRNFGWCLYVVTLLVISSTRIVRIACALHSARIERGY
jgi:hypothetical protein